MMLPQVDGPAIEGSVCYWVTPWWDDEADDAEGFRWGVVAFRPPAPGVMMLGSPWVLRDQGTAPTFLEAVEAASAAAERRSAIEGRRNAWLNGEQHVSLNIDPPTRRKPHGDTQTAGPGGDDATPGDDPGPGAAGGAAAG